MYPPFAAEPDDFAGADAGEYPPVGCVASFVVGVASLVDCCSETWVECSPALLPMAPWVAPGFESPIWAPPRGLTKISQLLLGTIASGRLGGSGARFLCLGLPSGPC